jgi:hypothetical protein
MPERWSQRLAAVFTDIGVNPMTELVDVEFKHGRRNLDVDDAWPNFSFLTPKPRTGLLFFCTELDDQDS